MIWLKSDDAEAHTSGVIGRKNKPVDKNMAIYLCEYILECNKSGNPVTSQLIITFMKDQHDTVLTNSTLRQMLKKTKLSLW